MRTKSSQPTLLLFLGAIVLLAACSNNGTDAVSEESSILEGYTFRPVEDIIDSSLEITDFASDGTATLPIQSSVPVACTIVYGTTPEFGSLSLDQDMAGGTHSDHSPLLSGLEPETEYYYRVQGVDDNGIVYLSEVMTFTTPKFEAEETKNLASAAKGSEILGYSSAFGGAGELERWGAGMAFDDNPNTEWSSNGDGNEAWIEVKLAQRARIDGIEFFSRVMSDGSAITLAFTVTTDDGETFGPFDVPDTDSSHTFDVALEAETVRFDLMNTTGGNSGAVDIAVYGEFLDD